MVRVFFAFMAVFLSITAVEAHADNTFIALSYHDVRDDVVDDLDEDRMATGSLNLISQFSWLREHGYHPVSLGEIIEAGKGGKPLPEKAVLLTFDDGYRSVYTKVFPLLKLFGYPAVVAVVGEWMEAGPGKLIDYGKNKEKRERFITWEQVRQMQESGLVEIASHSYGLHCGVLGNPQGNTQPAGITFIYDTEKMEYEPEERFRRRISADMKKSASLIKTKTGKRPRVMVWPYGAFNSIGAQEAASAGMPINLSLDACVNHVNDLRNICRILIDENPALDDFIWLLRNGHKRNDPIRVAHVDMDYLYDENNAQAQRNLDVLLDRIKELRINTVYLQAFADPDGDGVANSLYFPSRHMKMRADLFNRVAWQLRTRAMVDVYAWMPVLAFDIKDSKLAESLLVREWKEGEGRISRSWYRRLSPFHPEARRVIGEIYEDLAKHASFAGVLFHDDAYLNDFEDASAEAIKVYKDWGLPGDIDEIKADPGLFALWTRKKTETLAKFTDELTDKVKKYRPRTRTARNMYASAVMEVDAEAWLAQSLDVFLEHYDYIALMAMPYMEEAEDPENWLRELIGKVAKKPGALTKTVFELQSVDWREGKNLPAELLRKQMLFLWRMGAVNYGYYPDDFITGKPHMETLKEGMSLQSYPYEKR